MSTDRGFATRSRPSPTSADECPHRSPDAPSRRGHRGSQLVAEAFPSSRHRLREAVSRDDLTDPHSDGLAVWRPPEPVVLDSCRDEFHDLGDEWCDVESWGQRAQLSVPGYLNGCGQGVEIDGPPLQIRPGAAEHYSAVALDREGEEGRPPLGAFHPMELPAPHSFVICAVEARPHCCQKRDERSRVLDGTRFRSSKEPPQSGEIGRHLEHPLPLDPAGDTEPSFPQRTVTLAGEIESGPFAPSELTAWTGASSIDVVR